MSVWLIYIVEIIGTFILFTIGQGVTASTLLEGTKTDRKFINICLGWGTASFLAVIVSLNIGHLNPAISIGMLIANKNATVLNTIHHIIGQFIGTFLAQLIVIIKYLDFIKNERNPNVVLSVFATTPQDYSKRLSNFISISLSATIYFLISYGLITITNLKGFGFVSYLFGNQELTQIKKEDIIIFIIFLSFVATCKSLTLFGIGVSLTGSVGFTFNPFRDLVPRLMHQLCWGLKNKGPSYWLYGLQPIIIPFIPSAILGSCLRILANQEVVVFLS